MASQDLVIKVEDVHKRYRLGTIGSDLLTDELKAGWARLRGRSDPRLMIDDESTQRQGEYFWSLRGVSFEVERGEVLGIIGRNGAGKSTLLKLLSRITLPTSGTLRMRGKVTSLLEVGTGFHPELSGRENIFLNGTIMGMRRAEVVRHLDEIIAFSGIEHHIDTPIKRYSSGMKVRLGFAVAAHLDPDILILDEVLAVGDAEFQKKCLGKMREVSSSEGRTVFFVSHNMAAVKSLCRNAIVLEKGRVTFTSDSTSAINYYMKGDAEVDNYRHFGDAYDSEDMRLIGMYLNPADGAYDEPLDEYDEIELHLEVDIKRNAAQRRISFLLSNDDGVDLFVFGTARAGLALREGRNHLVCRFPKGFLNVGGYHLSLYLHEGSNSVFHERDMLTFHVQEGEREMGRWMGKELGFIKPVFHWEHATPNL